MTDQIAKFHCEKQPAPFIIKEDSDMISALILRGFAKQIHASVRKQAEFVIPKYHSSLSCLHK